MATDCQRPLLIQYCLATDCQRPLLKHYCIATDCQRPLLIHYCLATGCQRLLLIQYCLPTGHRWELRMWQLYCCYDIRIIHNFHDCLDRLQLLTQMLLKQGYAAPRLKSSVQKLFGRHHDLVDEIYISQMTMVLFVFTVDFSFPLSLPIHLPHLSVYMSNTAGVL